MTCSESVSLRPAIRLTQGRSAEPSPPLPEPLPSDSGTASHCGRRKAPTPSRRSCSSAQPYVGVPPCHALKFSSADRPRARSHSPAGHRRRAQGVLPSALGWRGSRCMPLERAGTRRMVRPVTGRVRPASQCSRAPSSPSPNRISPLHRPRPRSQDERCARRVGGALAAPAARGPARGARRLGRRWECPQALGHRLGQDAHPRPTDGRALARRHAAPATARGRRSAASDAAARWRAARWGRRWVVSDDTARAELAAHEVIKAGRGTRCGAVR